MIVRTSLLAACMVLVPGLALCSHHLPAEVRAAARHKIWQPVTAQVASWFSPGAGRPSAKPPPQREGPPTGPPAVAVGAASDSEAAAERLAASGAVAFECRQIAADREMHVASCRIAIDSAGQLHRVFQAPGQSPAAATAALVAEVEAWRHRQAVRAIPPSSSAAPEEL